MPILARKVLELLTLTLNVIKDIARLVNYVSTFFLHPRWQFFIFCVVFSLLLAALSGVILFRPLSPFSGSRGNQCMPSWSACRRAHFSPRPPETTGGSRNTLSARAPLSAKRRRPVHGQIGRASISPLRGMSRNPAISQPLQTAPRAHPHGTPCTPTMAAGRRFPPAHPSPRPMRGTQRK